MAAKFELELTDALRQLAEFNLRSSQLGRHLDGLQGDFTKTGSIAKELATTTKQAFESLNKALLATGTAAQKDKEAINSALVAIEKTAIQSYSKIAEAQLKSTIASAAYRGELGSVRKVLIETANNNAYVKGMEKQATLTATLTASNKLMRAQIQALATEEGKLNAKLKERLGSATKMAAAEQEQVEKNRQLTQQLELQGNIVGQLNTALKARLSSMQREQAEETNQASRLAELRRGYESLASGIQQQIAVQKVLNDGQTQAATFTERLNNQLAEQQRRYESLHGGTAEQIAQLKVLNSAREQEITLLGREEAALAAAKAKQASLNGGLAEQIARINEQNRARTEQIRTEEKYTASLVGVGANEARLQAQDEARVQSINAKNALLQAAARSTNLLSEADARNIAATEKLNSQTQARNAALVEEARATMGISKAQQELTAVRTREQETLARLQAQHALLTTEYGRELAAIKSKIAAQEQLNRLSTMSVGQLLGLTDAHKRHAASMVLGSQTAASLRAALGGLQANFGMYTSGTIVAASATYALFSQMRSTVALGAEFTASMATANAVMNSNNSSGMADGAKALETQVRALGQTTIFTASEVADGLINLGQAGLSSAESILALRPALDLAQIGNLSMAESADIATNVMMIFGKEAGDLTNIVDIMATAAVDSNTDIKQLANALTYAGPAAEAAGISLEQTTAAIEVLSNSGIKASRAGTALRKLFTSLLNPTEKGAAVLAKYNIATQNLDGSTRNLADIVKDLNKELNATGVSEAERLSSIQNLVGLYATSPVAALVKNAKQLDTALYTLEHNVAGAAERMRNKMSETLKVDWKNTMSAYEEVQLEVYDKFEAYLRLTSAKITKTLVGLTQPVKVTLNTDTSHAGLSTQDLVDKANANGNNYTVKDNKAYSAAGEIVDAKQLVAAMKEVDQSQLTVISNLDIMVEKFKTFGETAAILIAGLVSNKALGAVNNAFSNLSSDITTKLIPRMGELQARTQANSLAFGMLSSRAAAGSASMAVFNTTMALTNRAAGLALSGVTFLARGLNFLAIGASFVTGILGIAAAIGSIGYAIYNAYSKDNEQAIIDHAEAVKGLRAEYDLLNQGLDSVGKSLEKQALREEAVNLTKNISTYKARLAVLKETEATYKQLGEEVPKPVSIEIGVNEERLKQTEKELNDFNKRINAIGSNSADVTNASDLAKRLADAVVAQEKRVSDARIEADATIDDSRVSKEIMYNAELDKLKSVRKELQDQKEAIKDVGDQAITVANQINAAMIQSRAAADKAFIKELSPGQQYDSSLEQMKTLSRELKELEAKSVDNKVVDPQIVTKLKAMSDAQLMNAKALAGLNEQEAEAAKQREAADLAGLGAAQKKIVYQQQVASLTAEQARLEASVASGDGQGVAREKLIDVTNRLTTAKNGLASSTKSEASSTRSAASAQAKYEDKLGDFIGKQEASAAASQASAEAYRNGSSAVAEYQIQQQLSNEVLALENQKISVNAAERKKMEAAIRSANQAKQEEDVQKSLMDMRTETQNVIDQTTATYQGEEALRKFNVEKQIQQALLGKSPDIVLRDAAAIREQAEAQSLANKNLESANRGVALRDQYAPAAKYARDYAESVNDIEAAHKAGALTDEEYVKSLRGVGDAYNDNMASTTIWGKLTQDALNRVDESFVDMWKNVGHGFKDFSESLLDSFKQLLAELAHEAITKPIMISFVNAITGSTKSGGIGDTIDSWMNNTSAGGGGSGLSGALGTIKNTVSVAGSKFGEAVMSGWSSGEGITGGIQGAFNGGADYVKDAITSAFTSGSAVAATSISEGATAALSASYANYAAQFGTGLGGASYTAAASSVAGGTSAAAGGAAAASTTATAASAALSSLSIVLSYIQGVYTIFTSFKDFGLKGAAVTGGMAAAGAYVGSFFGPIGTAAGFAIGAVLGAMGAGKLFSSGEKYPDLSTSATGRYVNGQYSDTGVATGWQTKAPKYGSAADAAMSSNLNKFSSTLGMLYAALGDGSPVVAYNTMQVRKTSGKYSTTMGAQLDDGSVLTDKQQFSAKDAAAALTENYDNLMGTFLAKAIVSSKSLPEYFRAQFVTFAGDWNTTADQVIKAIEDVFTRFNGVNQALALINVNGLKMDQNGMIASDNILNMVATMAKLDMATATTKDKVDALNTSVSDYYSAFFTQEEQFQDLKKSLTGALGNFGLQLPDSKESYRALVESIDVSTAAGQAMFATFIGLSKTAASYYDEVKQKESDAAQVAKDAADKAQDAAQAMADLAQKLRDLSMTNVDSAMKGLQASVDAQKALLEKAYNDSHTTLETTISAISESINGLESALKTLRGSSDEVTKMMFKQARTTLLSAVQRVRGGGTLEGFNGLQDALDAVSSNTKDSYNTLQDYLFDQGVNAGLVEELGQTSETQMSLAKKQLKALEDSYKSQTDLLDQQIKDAQNSLDALNGINNTVLSVKDALLAFNQTIVEALKLSTGNGSQNSSASNAELVKAVYNAVLGRDPDAAGSAAWTGALNNGLGLGNLGGAIAGSAQGGGGKDAASGSYYLNTTVEAAYKATLGRAADPAGLAFWSSQLASGKMTLDQLKAALAGSVEAGNKHANGAAFTNGVVSKPTLFNASLMGEAGSEGILPLTNVGGSLGVDARISSSGGGGGSEGGVVAVLSAKLDKLDQALRSIAKHTERTSSNTKFLENWDNTGLPEERV